MTTASHVSDDTRPDWTEKLAQNKRGLAALSFAESTVVPVPLETIVAPLMAAHHRHAMAMALTIWLGCLVGAAVFYAVGYWLSDPVVVPVLTWLGLEDQLTELQDRLDSEGLFWTVFIVSVTPIPLQIATLGAGAAGGNFLVFLGAVALSRGLRYFGMALLAVWFGPKIADWQIPKGKLIFGMTAILLIIWGVRQLL